MSENESVVDYMDDLYEQPDILSDAPGEPQAAPSAIDTDELMAQQEQRAAEAVERIERLLADVQALKPVFVGIVDFCREQRTPAEVDERYDELTEYNMCTFSPVRVRALLEEAGALAYIEEKPAEAEDADADVEAGGGESVAVGDAEPCGEAGDGVEAPGDADAAGPEEADDGCYTITKRPEGMWVATKEGLEVIDAINPAAELAYMLDEEPEFVPMYGKVLEALLNEPKSVDELSEIIDGEALMIERHRYVPFLIRKLEDHGAVEFRGKWTILRAGEDLLSSIVESEGMMS